MSKKRKNKGRKSLTAVSAVVAAGLSPGIASSTPVPQPLNTEIELTAADAVAINGDVFGFDELFAMQQPSSEPQIIKTVYGPPPPDDRIKEEEQKAQRERARMDSIRLAQERQSQALVYGPPPPKYKGIGPEELRSMAATDRESAVEVVRNALMDYCAKMPYPDAEGNIYLSEDYNLVSELKMGHMQLEMLQQEIENRFGVQLTEDMLKQLGTLRRIAKFVVTVVTPTRMEE